MSTNALPSQGVTLKIGSSASPIVYTAISDITEITGPDGSAGEIETTDLSSTSKTFIRGLPDNGSVSFTINYIPANTQHAQLFADFSSATETARNYRLTFTDSPATTWTFSGYVSTFSISNGLDDKLTASCAIRIKGSITEA
jgi:hypothetical protein